MTKIPTNTRTHTQFAVASADPSCFVTNTNLKPKPAILNPFAVVSAGPSVSCFVTTTEVSVELTGCAATKVKLNYCAETQVCLNPNP